MIEVSLDEEKVEDADDNAHDFVLSLKNEMARAVELFNSLMRSSDKWGWQSNGLCFLPDHTYAVRGKLQASAEVIFKLLSELDEEKRKLWDNVIHIEKGTEIFPQEKLHFVGLQMNRRTAHGVLAIRPGMITFVKHPHRTRVYDSWELPFAAFHIYVKPLGQKDCFFTAVFRFEYNGMWPPSYSFFDMWYASSFVDYFKLVEKRALQMTK
jgi:hypothetical protein